MTLAQARAELQSRGLGMLSDSRSNQFLNDGYHEFNEYSAWPWLHKTTTGTAPLAIADLREALYVVDTTLQCELQGVDVRDVVDADPAQVSTGYPLYYYVDESSGTPTVKLWPTTATDTLSVRYLRVPADLSADGDTPVFPARYASLWVTLAQARALSQSQSDVSIAQQVKQAAYQDLQNAADLYLDRTHDSPQQQVMTSDADSTIWRGW